MQLPLLVAASVGTRIGALACLQASGGIWATTLMLLAQGFERSVYTVLAVVASLLTFAGGMVFARFFDRELEP